MTLPPPLPISALTRRGDRFVCEAMHMTLSAEACGRYHDAANAAPAPPGPRGRTSHAETKARQARLRLGCCRGCEVGREVKERTAGR
jgi:hypothetical protein